MPPAGTLQTERRSGTFFAQMASYLPHRGPQAKRGPSLRQIVFRVGHLRRGLAVPLWPGERVEISDLVRPLHCKPHEGYPMLRGYYAENDNGPVELERHV